MLIDNETRGVPVLAIRLAFTANWVETAFRALRRRLAYPDEFAGLQLGLDAETGLVIVEYGGLYQPLDPTLFFRRVCHLLDISGNQTW